MVQICAEEGVEYLRPTHELLIMMTRRMMKIRSILRVSKDS